MVCPRAILLSKDEAEAAEASTTRVRLSTESSLPGPHQLPPRKNWTACRLAPLLMPFTELRGYHLSRLYLCTLQHLRKNSSWLQGHPQCQQTHARHVTRAQLRGSSTLRLPLAANRRSQPAQGTGHRTHASRLTRSLELCFVRIEARRKAGDGEEGTA
jgi:hypothetical protein